MPNTCQLLEVKIEGKFPYSQAFNDFELIMISNSSQVYDDARKLTESIDSNSNTSSTAAIIERTLLLQRSATASGVCSIMLQRKVGALQKVLFDHDSSFFSSYP